MAFFLSWAFSRIPPKTNVEFSSIIQSTFQNNQNGTSNNDNKNNEKQKTACASKPRPYSNGRCQPFAKAYSTFELISTGSLTHIDSIYHKFHPLSIIMPCIYLLIYQKLSLLSFLMALFIFLCVRESLQIIRHASTQNTLDWIRTILQMIGDVMIIPYQMLCGSAETPLIQHQNTEFNSKILEHCPSLKTFSPTLWTRHAFVAFIVAMFEEMFLFNRKKHIIQREILETADEGIIALDWWIPYKHNNESQNKRRQEWKYCYYKKYDIEYKSKIFYEYNEKYYNEEFNINEYPNGQNTPIAFIFTTYAGDALAAPTRKLCEFFVENHWRVVCFCKRGCGSPYHENLPYTTPKCFDLTGIGDSKIAVEHVVKRYPHAPKFAIGLSVGGSQMQDYMATINREYNHFIAGIKIDGLGCWHHDLISFNRRQNLISKILADVVFHNFRKYALSNIKKVCQSGFNLEALFINENDNNKNMSIKNSKQSVDMKYLVEHVIAPSHDFISNDWEQYLYSKGPIDVEFITRPILMLHSWNDSFQDPYDMPIDVAKANSNIIHCITAGGTHCIRREGLFFNKCWLSKVCLEYCNAILKNMTDINLLQ